MCYDLGKICSVLNYHFKNSINSKSTFTEKEKIECVKIVKIVIVCVILLLSLHNAKTSTFTIYYNE